MYELVKITENDYYIDCPAKMGVVAVGDNRVIMIDSGNDKDAAKKALRAIQERGWVLKAVFNTHSHADHIGGNRFLQEKTGCSIYAKGLECSFSNEPVLEPMTLNGGRPYSNLRNKFLMAKESTVQPLDESVLPEGMKLISLPGHSFDMVGFITKDGTAYIADSVSSEETLAKYGIGYLWDCDEALKTLEFLKGLDAKIFVPSHADVTENINPLADINISALKAVSEKILELCEIPVCFEPLLKNIFDSYSLAMTAQQYALIGSTLRSYLSCLYDKGQLTFIFEDNRMLWQKVRV